MAESNEDLACPAVTVDDGIIDPSNDDFECACGNIGSRLICILGYNGSTKHILINYSLIFVNLAYCVLDMKRGDTADSELRFSPRRKHLERRAAMALTFVVLFQIVLCLAVRCSGVSIIWCAICGWIMSRHKRQIGDNNDSEHEQQSTSSQISSSKLEILENIVVLIDILAIVYYAVTFGFITTVAHVCALVLGAILFSISDAEYNNLTRDSPSTSQQTEALLCATPNNSNGVINVENQQSR
jgi:hypothetical protein